MIAKMEANGLMERWRKLQSFSNTKVEDIGPQILTMDHLRLGFLACCIFMVLAIIAFTGEHGWLRFVPFVKKDSKDSRKFNHKTETDAKNFPSEFRRTQAQRRRNVEHEELMEMHGIAVAEIHQEVRVEALIGNCNDGDLVLEELCDDVDALVDKFDSRPH